MNWVKKLMLFRLFTLVIQLKEADNNMQFEDIEKKRKLMSMINILLGNLIN